MDFDDFSMLRSLNSVINFGLFACLIGAILTLIVPYAIQSEKDEDALYQKIEGGRKGQGPHTNQKY